MNVFRTSRKNISSTVISLRSDDWPCCSQETNWLPLDRMTTIKKVTRSIFQFLLRFLIAAVNCRRNLTRRLLEKEHPLSTSLARRCRMRARKRVASLSGPVLLPNKTTTIRLASPCWPSDTSQQSFEYRRESD